MSSSARILYRGRTKIVVCRIRPLGVFYGSIQPGEPEIHAMKAMDLDLNKQVILRMERILAWGDEAVERVLALQPLSAAAPDGPWRTVESGRHPGEEHLVGAKDRVLMGHGDRASIVFLKAAGEFCRNLFPSEK